MPGYGVQGVPSQQGQQQYGMPQWGYNPQAQYGQAQQGRYPNMWQYNQSPQPQQGQYRASTGQPIGTNPPAQGPPRYGNGQSPLPTPLTGGNQFRAPQTPTYTPLTPGQSGAQAGANPYNPQVGGQVDPYNREQWSDSNYERLVAFENMRMAQGQLSQNNYQYGLDFNEDQRRFNTQYEAQRQNDIFAQSLAGAQHELAGWQAQAQDRQFGQQLGFEQLRNTQQFGLQQQGQNFNQGLQNRQFGLQEQGQNFGQGMQTRQFNEGQRQFNQQYGENARQFDTSQQNQMAQAAANRQSQELQSRYQAFGRAQAPNARVMRSW